MDVSVRKTGEQTVKSMKLQGFLEQEHVGTKGVVDY
jgi:hypothetical protein